MFQAVCQVPLLKDKNENTEAPQQIFFEGVIVDWEMAKAQYTDDSEVYTEVEDALKSLGGRAGAYLPVFLAPIHEIPLMVEERGMPEVVRAVFEKWMDAINTKRKQLTASKKPEVQSKAEETSPPTLCLCRCDRLCAITDDNLTVNPTIPPPDWFRCANANLRYSNAGFRVLPYLRQRCKTDDVYAAAVCTPEEYETFEEVRDYAVRMEKTSAEIWSMTLNYAIEVLKGKNGKGRILEIVMKQERKLLGVLLSSMPKNELNPLCTRMEIDLL